MQQGLKGLQNRAANHRRNQPSVSSSSKLGKFSASNKENWHHYGYDEHDSKDDSGICLLINSGDREVQKETSKSSSPGCKFSSLAIYGAGVGVSSNPPTLDSVSRTSEYRNVFPSHERVLSADVK
jgi:hypothetical protein